MKNLKVYIENWGWRRHVETLTPSPRRARVSRMATLTPSLFASVLAYQDLTPSGIAWRRQVVLPADFWHFVEFFTFMLQKRPKCFLFQISSQKYLKWQKERFRVIIDQINTNSGLNDPPKALHFSPHHIPLHLRFACPQANALLF